MQRGREIGHGVVVSKMQWLCSQLCYVTAANPWTIVEIELLATVGWKWGCQPFSCSCLKNMTHSRKEIYATYLSKESISAINFGNSKHPLPTKSFRFLRAAVPSAFWLHHANAFLEICYDSSRFPTSADRSHGFVPRPSLVPCHIRTQA